MSNSYHRYLHHARRLATAVMPLFLIAFQLLAFPSVSVRAALSGVAPKTPPLTTPWTAAATAAIANPLPEYPRPQMVRTNWQSLNGEWQWQSAANINTPPTGQTLSGRINVPYPVESALSGQMLNGVKYMWYRRTFTVPAGWAGQQVLLNFGAVDWRSVVYINGTLKGTHEGGYDAFTYNITAQLNGGTNEIIVGVYDPTDADSVNQPMGKQRVVPDLGIMYTGSSGIWQTVWIEPAPTAFVSRLDMTPNIDNGTLNVVVQGTAGQNATVTALLPGTQTVVGSNSGAVGANISVPVPSPHLWTPDDPYLYDIRVNLNGGDVVTGYFGMRKVSMGMVNGILRPLLNNQFVFQLGTLDQGFWPDGIYTAPTDDALRFDLEQQKALGYNTVRKHIKVEPQRWFYWADKLGIMIWQDMPTMPNPPNSAQQTRHTNEFHEMVDEHRSSPSIIMWVDHNEGWGQYNQAGLATTVKGWDPSRLVNNMSGVNCCGAVDGGNGDVIDYHCYLGPCSPTPSGSRAAVLGEFGGLGLKVAGHEWNAAASHSYTMETSATNLTNHYVSLAQQAEGLVNSPGLSAAIYTEPVDVEAEVNGWFTYDRLLKITSSQLTSVRNANLSLISAVNVTYSTLVPTSETTAQSWKYTTSTPPAGWQNTSFNDTAWSTGNAGFGTAGTPGAIVRTTWNTADLWMRRTFNPGSLTATQRSNLVFRLHHDEDAELYINGTLAASVTSYTSNYVYIALNTAGQNAVVANGNNVLAVHVHQTTGGQYMDAGLSVKNTGGPTPTPGPTNTPTRTNTPGPTPTPTNTSTPGPTPTPTNTPVPGAGVIFYQDINFGGVASGAKGPGDYPSLPADVPNDWMSSLKVPAGWVVDTYADGNFVGAVCSFAADSTFVGSGCNDIMSSFRIYKPVAFYALENNASDSSGNGNNGTLFNSPTFVAGHLGQAVNLNGTNNYVQIPRSIQDSFTIAFWVKTTQTGGAGTHWWSGRGLVDGEVANVANDFGVALVGAQAAFGVGNADTTIKSTSNINDGAWHHIAVTRNSTTGAMVLYFGGVQQASATGPTGTKNSPPNLRLGSLQTNLNFFAGQIDEVKLYTVALTAGQVAAVAAQ